MTDFWKDVKNKRGKGSDESVMTVGSVSGVKNVCDMWKDHYEHILNSNNDSSKKKAVMEFLTPDKEAPSEQTDNFKPGDIKAAIEKLKCNKASGTDGIKAEHYKFAHERLIILMCLLFNASLVHSYLPLDMLDTIITPIVKDKRGDITDKDNYRPIAVTCIASKVLENCIIGKYDNLLHSTDNQFGFKSEHSTDMCVFTLKEIVQSYTSSGSPVYMCFMDASKAFDTVNHWVLFDKLINRGMPYSIVRLLLEWYRKQECYVKWAGFNSSSFTVSNGVRQGGVLSPKLFNVVVDDLSKELNQCYAGCHFNGQSQNHLFYADDSVLLAPSPDALQHLVNICQNYALEHGMRYNVKKTVCMCVKPKVRKDISVPQITLNGKCLKWKHEHTYLGVLLQDNSTDANDINRQVRCLYTQGNLLLRKFNKCSDDVKCLLFRSYCTNLYCASLWCNYTASSFSRIKVAYNNIFRMLLSVKRREVYGAYVRFNVDSFQVVLRKSIYTFIQRLLKSNNCLISNIVTSLSFISGSTLYTQWMTMLYKY